MEISVIGNVAILDIKEGLTANRVGEYNATLEKFLSEKLSYDEMVLNLNRTENIDSVGVTFVIGVYKKNKAMDKCFKVSGVSGDVKALFCLMKLDKFFEMLE